MHCYVLQYYHVISLVTFAYYLFNLCPCCGVVVVIMRIVYLTNILFSIIMSVACRELERCCIREALIAK